MIKSGEERRLERRQQARLPAPRLRLELRDEMEGNGFGQPRMDAGLLALPHGRGSVAEMVIECTVAMGLRPAKAHEKLGSWDDGR